MADALLAGRRALDGVKGIRLLDDYRWHDQIGKWVLKVALDIGPNSSEFVPAVTEWFIHVHETYPLGPIKLFPAKVGGLTVTFPHQDYNADGEAELPWRQRALCLDSSVRALGRHGHDPEPSHADLRLHWHAMRAIEWLEAAAAGELIAKGDPFELPKFPEAASMGIPVVHEESPATFDAWLLHIGRYGLVDFVNAVAGKKGIIVRRFKTSSGAVIRDAHWGRAVVGPEEEAIRGVWILLPEVPILPPWQAPANWGELRQAVQAQGIGFERLLKSAVRCARRTEACVLLLGFPIPLKMGQGLEEVHWQALQIPKLERGGLVPRGFRPNDKGFWQRDRATIFANGVTIAWIKTANWHSDRLQVRGRYAEGLRRLRVAMIGAGALGSLVAEMLVRGGVTSLQIIDGDWIEAGNLLRHTLSFEDLNENKALAMAARLNKVSIHSDVQGYPSGFPLDAGEGQALLEKTQVVLDCTGSDELLAALARCHWDEEKLFISASVGLGGRRLFVFVAAGRAFPADSFVDAMAPWLKTEESEWKGTEVPWEGAGCWSPLFPARIDDLALMASIAVKLIEEGCVQPPLCPTLHVFEQLGDPGRFLGLRRAEACDGGPRTGI